jgi:hypothetical protein
LALKRRKRYEGNKGLGGVKAKKGVFPLKCLKASRTRRQFLASSLKIPNVPYPISSLSPLGENFLAGGSKAGIARK